MPLTTKSVKARDLYQRALQDYELLYLERASIGWRAAAKEDPEFAAAFAMIALNSRDPEEMRTARQQAIALAAKASPGEKLLIRWVAAAQEGNFLEGIAAMNDMVAMFPRDKHVLYIAANWLMGVQGHEQAHNLLHKALEVDPQFAPALNNLAYLHARDREFDEALQDMDEYAALVPKEPNSQDSYGEILRMAGLFEASLMHYRSALSIDPNFNTSQAGLGDTYSLMGDQEKARQEYDKAIANEPNPANRFDYRMQKAITWVREKNYTEADREFWRISVKRTRSLMNCRKRRPSAAWRSMPRTISSLSSGLHPPRKLSLIARIFPSPIRTKSVRGFSASAPGVCYMLLRMMRPRKRSPSSASWLLPTAAAPSSNAGMAPRALHSSRSRNTPRPSPS